MKYLSVFGVFFVYALTSCAGLYLLKAAESLVSLKFVAGGALYVSGAAIWIVILRLFPLSVAFPLASGMLMIGTTLSGYFLLGEELSPVQFLGVVLILIGITCVSTVAGNHD